MDTAKVWSADHWPYQNHDKDAKPHQGTSSILQTPILGLLGYGCTWHLQIQQKETRFGKLLSQRSLTISKSLSPSCNKELSKYFPEEIHDKWFKDKPSYQMKGCWNSDLNDELELMFDECGGELEKIECQESLCNKDADPPVS